MTVNVGVHFTVLRSKRKVQSNPSRFNCSSLKREIGAVL